MSHEIVHEEVYEPTPKHIQGPSGKARERYKKFHSQESTLSKVVTRSGSGNYRKGKPYYNYLLRLPKPWADGLELKAKDVFEWSIISYDPVILQLRKIEEGDSA